MIRSRLLGVISIPYLKLIIIRIDAMQLISESEVVQ